MRLGHPVLPAIAMYRGVARVLVVLVASLGALLVTADVPRAATITVVNHDGPGEGFNDPTPATPAGGNTGATLGAQRLNAFQFAADLWGALIDSPVEIRVGANFDPLTCGASSAVLGSAGPVTVTRDFVGAPEANTWYPIALANALSGTDLAPDEDDITARSPGTTASTAVRPGGRSISSPWSCTRSAMASASSRS
jgi:hypothetical protein